MRFFVRISYDGSNFSGWQEQNNTRETIQGKIQEAFQIIGRTAISVTGCGRTDAGVHASQYYFHFDSHIDWIGKEYNLNKVLPEAIAIHKIKRVNPGFHARYDALKREYTYKIHQGKDPFLIQKSTQRNFPLDVEILSQASTWLVGRHDFASFCKTGSDVDSTICTIFKSEWEDNQNSWTYTIQGNRFLRGMVRLIVGMCLHVHDGKMELNEIKERFSTGMVLPKPYSAAPYGLYLSSISYPFPVD